MAITNGTIIKKMIDELYQAKESQHSHAKMVAHIANVRLLSDLFLEEDQKAEQETEFTKEEMKAMIGEQPGSKQVQQKQATKPIVNHEEANGKSIFDF
ncbi:YwdI family protein [Oceanobacillus sp. CF4.6]|uniref:YwdI family protein n=1 Tax=Oceanobacillus sp. CF4.6 TaxID=3373080 RepID=UPI003EE7BDFF